MRAALARPMYRLSVSFTRSIGMDTEGWDREVHVATGIFLLTLSLCDAVETVILTSLAWCIGRDLAAVIGGAL